MVKSKILEKIQCFQGGYENFTLPEKIGFLFGELRLPPPLSYGPDSRYEGISENVIIITSLLGWWDHNTTRYLFKFRGLFEPPIFEDHESPRKPKISPQKWWLSKNRESKAHENETCGPGTSIHAWIGYQFVKMWCFGKISWQKLLEKASLS